LDAMDHMRAPHSSVSVATNYQAATHQSRSVQ
jgi:hypothetical protein